MAFSEFKTVGDALVRYGIIYSQEEFIDAQPETPPDHLLKEFEFDRKNLDVFSTEASRCQRVIYPILKEVYKSYAGGFNFWIQQPLSVDSNLNGTPDYMIASRSKLGIVVVGKPLVIVIEAKKNDFDMGWGQCLAEMVAAQKLNEDESTTIYGIVTDGERWQFGKLLKKDFTKHPASFFIERLPELFGAVRFVFEAACGAVKEFVEAK